jgi:dienelactone hydrolase
MARFMQEKEVGTIIRMGNLISGTLPWPKTSIDNLRFVMDYCKRNSELLSGRADPRMYMMGYSSGAGIVAIVASEFSNVEKILLIAPGGDCGLKRTKEGLEKYRGEVYIAIGKNDHTVGTKAGDIFYRWATQARKKELVKIPQCSHDFEGETNSRILSKAPLWAFAGDETFPSPEGGRVMYDKGKNPSKIRFYHSSGSGLGLVEVPPTETEKRKYLSDLGVTRISGGRN